MTLRTTTLSATVATLALVTGACRRDEKAPHDRGVVETTSAGQGKVSGEANALSAEEARALAEEAYVYGYPLVTMEMTRRVMTNTAAPAPTTGHAPMGQFGNVRAYPTPQDRDVTAPNADTLYSLAWMDLSKEPYVFSIPDAGDRYYLMPILDGFTEVFEVPGKRTTGTKAQTYAITGPGWQGKLPEGMKEYRSATNLVWILGRTYCTGTPADYAAVHAFQDKLTLVPLGAYGKPYTPPAGKVDPSVDMKTPVREQVERMDAPTYFKMLNGLLRDNPPNENDAPLLARIGKIGVGPNRDFDVAKLGPAAKTAVLNAPAAAIQSIEGQAKKSGKTVDGWLFSLETGTYGTDYLQRAFVTRIGLGANHPEDAVYPTSEADANGKPYVGTNKYVMHFAKGELPPVKGFWSLTMYDDKYFFVDNPLHRYSVSPRNDLAKNADGSVDLYIQKDSPGKDKESNWLPAPAGRFNLMLRTYWPEKPLLDGTWKPPAVEIATK